MQFEEPRNTLQRFSWKRDITTVTESSETWFPPDGLPIAGVSLYRRNGGYWGTVGHDGDEVVGGCAASLEDYLQRRQPYV